MIGGNGGWLSSFITGMANFSAQYNFQSIAIVLIIMSASICTSDDDSCREGEQASWVEGTSSAVIFVGAVCGQLSMGFLGDYLSRSQALTVTLSLASISALLSSIASTGSPTSIYSIVIVFRFFLGIGLGGVFPLSATKACEDASESKGKVNSKGSSWAFFWQVPGLLGPWMLGYIFTFTNLATETRWRLILGIGAIPSFLSILGLTYESYLAHNADHSNDNRSSVSSISSAIKLSLGLEPSEPNKHKISLSEVWRHMQNPVTRMKLIAAGGSWFLYDVVVYGLGLLAAFIIDAISSDDDNVSNDANIRNICSKQLIALSLSTPTTILSIAILPYFGLKKLQMLAFLTITTSFAVMAGMFVYLKEADPNGLFALYCLCSMSCNFGIGITTFSMPPALFEKDIRATFNGIACAMGKTGAIVGAYSFYSIAVDTSYAAVLGMCACIAFCGFLVTYFCIDQNELNKNTNEGGVTMENMPAVAEKHMEMSESFAGRFSENTMQSNHYIEPMVRSKLHSVDTVKSHVEL